MKKIKKIQKVEGILIKDKNNWKVRTFEETGKIHHLTGYSHIIVKEYEIVEEGRGYLMNGATVNFDLVFILDSIKSGWFAKLT